MSRGWLLPFLGCLGCDAPLCDELDSTFIRANEAISGSALLSDAGDETRSRFVAKLSGIPELWQAPDYYRDAGSASVSAALSYENPPQGGSARTQMPIVLIALSFNNEPDVGGTATPPFPGPSPQSISRPLFQRCSEAQPVDCCPIGATQCEQSFRLRIERVDGTAFPPVKVDWSLTATANVGNCSGTSQPTLELSEVLE